MELPSDAFGNYRKDILEAIPVLYQAGYLTITDYNQALDTYCLNYPNQEVRNVLVKEIQGYSTAKS
jgi:hypothetical protein